ncbi:MAG: porin family protein [Desulfobulbaceae bacterium]|nr:porin family protein [Desulfobulbaceae bacterium]
MKKKILIVAGCIVIIFLSTSAHGAEETSYMSANFLGLNAFINSEATNSNTPVTEYSIEANPGFAVGAAVGYDFFGYLRMEGEIAYQNNALAKARTAGGNIVLHEDIDSLALLLNFYCDFTNNSLWTPYLSAGLGPALVNVDDNTGYLGDSHDSVFAYQVGAGLGYAFDKELTLEFKYRYFATTNPEFNNIEMEYATHNVYAGMRYSF